MVFALPTATFASTPAFPPVRRPRSALASTPPPPVALTFPSLPAPGPAIAGGAGGALVLAATGFPEAVACVVLPLALGSALFFHGAKSATKSLGVAGVVVRRK